MSSPAARIARVAADYLLRRTVLRGGPLRLHVEPTNVCNLQCPMCRTPFLGPDVPKGLMSLDTFGRVVEATREHVLDVFLLLGGEPLLNKKLPEMVRIARAARLYTRLHTNATLLDEQRAHALLDAELDFISFSFDGCDEDTYREYRVGGDFATTCDNIKRFARLKRERGARRPRTVVQLIERPHWSAAERAMQRSGIRALFADPGIDRFKFIRLHNFAGFLEGPGFDTDGSFSPCSFLWYTLNVGFDGTVVPCCLDYSRKLPLGNLLQQPLMEIWNGPQLVALRQKMVAARIEDVELCRKCDVPRKPRLLGLPLRNLSALRELTESAASALGRPAG